MNAKKACIALTAGTLGLGTGLTGASAQDSESVDFRRWSAVDKASYISTAAMIDAADVYDQDGEVIGEVEDLIAAPDGTIRKLVIEAGGFLDIGDTHFAYPIATANIEGPNEVRVRFDDDDISSYSLFTDIDDEPAEGRN